LNYYKNIILPGELISTGKKYIKTPEDGNNFILKENDIVMARTGATFAKLLLYKNIEPSILNTIKITLKKFLCIFKILFGIGFGLVYGFKSAVKDGNDSFFNR
jgi:hypothetical protein